MRKRNAGEGIRSRQYRRMQLLRGFVCAVLVAVVFGAILSAVLLTGSRKERITLNDWANTRAFSGKYSHAELRDAYKASHAAYKHYVRRDQMPIDHSKIDKAFDKVRNEADLVAVLNELNTMSGDPYVRLWSQNEYDHFFAVVNGMQVGVELGFNFDWQNNRWVVQYCPPESSAARAGIQVGDELISLDADSVHVFGQGWQAGQLIEAKLNNGLLGSTINVVVRRDGEFITADVERIATRGFPALDSNMFWSPFQSRQVENARVIRFISLFHVEAISSLQAELEAANRNKVDGLVLDLTEGFGGDQENGMRIAAMFLEKGVIAHRISVTAEGSLLMHTWEVKDGKVWLHTKGPYSVTDGKVGEFPKEQPKSEQLDWPCGVFKGQVVISVSDMTRGAAEVIVAALISDKSRCEVVGSSWTGGKGCGLSHYMLGSGYVLRLSTSFFLKPDGKPIEGVGIEPTIGVNPNMDPTSVATMVLANRLQVVPKPVLPDEGK